MVLNIDKLMNRGLGGITPYAGGKHKEEAIEKYGVRKPVKLSSNENALGVSPMATEHAGRILSQANLYPEGSSRILREKLAERFALSPDCIVVGSGADEIIYYVAIAITNDGDEIIIPSITFPIYEIAFRMMRANIVKSAMDGFFIDLEDILRRINSKTKCITLCNPNNPTGHALGRNEVKGFIEKVPPGIIILMDEAYMDFADMDSFPDSIGMFREGRRNLVIVRTLSKAFGLAGFRVGYGIGDESMVSLMNRIKLPFNVSIVSQHAALGALSDRDFLIKTLKNTQQGRSLIYKALEKLGLSYVRSSTNFILIDTGNDGDLVTEELMKRGVIVRSAKNYGMPTCIRVTIGTEAQNRRFIEALSEFLQG